MVALTSDKDRMMPPDAARTSLEIVLLGDLVKQLLTMGGMTPSKPAARMTKMAATRRCKV